jgi:hypothetical protein
LRVQSRFENDVGSSSTVETVGTVGQGGGDMGSGVQEETNDGDPGPSGGNHSLVLAAIKERQENPEEFIKLYKGGAWTKLQSFLTSQSDYSTGEISSDPPGDFTLQQAIYLTPHEEVAKYYAKIRRRMDDKLDQRYGVLSIHIKEPQHTVVDGDLWKEASFCFF